MPNGLVVDVSKIKPAHKRFLKNHDEAFRRVLSRQPILSEVRRHVGNGILIARRSGNLLKQTDVRIIRTKDRTLVRVTNSAIYAIAQNDGSGLYGARGAKYPITPKNPGGFLRFFWHKKGIWFTARKVMHPGVHPTHFFEIASDLTFRTRLALLQAAMRSVARNF